jgi:hypothetical protein
VSGSSPRTAAAIIAAAGVSLLAAACGGSPGNHVAQLASTATQSTSSSTPSARSAHQNDAVAFARCMRSHGVPNWPDPNSSGVFDKSKLTSQQLGATDAKVAAAETACRGLLPNGGSGPTPAQLQQERTQALKFSQCVRAHGGPNFPDPDAGGIDQGSPKFQAANQACGKYRPPYMPSNAEYNAYVRTHG